MSVSDQQCWDSNQLTGSMIMSDCFAQLDGEIQMRLSFQGIEPARDGATRFDFSACKRHLMVPLV